MRHHFGDFLDRDGSYWTIVPNRERYAHRIDDVPEGSADITITTIGKEDENWARALSFPNLVELTLHEPTAEQLTAIGAMPSIKRLRITHARPQTLDFIRTMRGVEELVLEYVSGFSDLSPLGELPNLRALHMENLRRVSSFGGLAGAASLRYLAIYGTTDWEQPIEDFEFLRGLSQLEVFALWQAKCRAPYPAMRPAIHLRQLKKLRIHRSYLATDEFALLEEALGGVEGTAWGPFETVARSQIPLPADDARARLSDDVIRASHPEVSLHYNGQRFIDDPTSRWFEFTGRAAGRVKCSSASAEAKCLEKSQLYEGMRQRARALVEQERAA
ncbi:hypothetical protein RT97_02240 [Variovorax paradoxus]|uniref:Leucine-rich repeat domain-containing protein n=1 Tax=Variovorax paradoxus TaxID=34073 RepID=A0A0D0MZS0_VARPD|nr:hypothetical protein [Variovorax paradoxus]KIQ36319.1 hypothetical protein RT97_02240 [Variovorax paradoxus]